MKAEPRNFRFALGSRRWRVSWQGRSLVEAAHRGFLSPLSPGDEPSAPFEFDDVGKVPPGRELHSGNIVQKDGSLTFFRHCATMP
ncbi:hypothetical protein [Bradyrhizobium sp. JR3.5]